MDAFLLDLLEDRVFTVRDFAELPNGICRVAAPLTQVRRAKRWQPSLQPVMIRSWAREHPGQPDDAWFKREIAPKLDAFSLKEIAEATGLSLAACSRIRAGAKVLHPRHWEALEELVRS